MPYQFMRDFLFGNKNSCLKPTNNILLNQLINDIQRFHDVKHIILNGGILHHDVLVINDLNRIIEYIEKGNSYNFEKSSMKNNPNLEFQSEIVRIFFHQLRLACRGDINNGIISNNYVNNISPTGDQSDRETLEHILNDDNEFYLTYKNAEYWGNIAKELIQKKRPFQITPIKTPIKVLNDVQIMYDLKCQSVGSIINPLSYAFVSHESHLNSVHWETPESLQLFMVHCPNNKLSATVRNLINLIVKSIMNAENKLLPQKVIDNEDQIRNFIGNIKLLDNTIEKVSGFDTPLKLIDVMHRILALLKFDYLWQKIELSQLEETNESLSRILLYNCELERENKLLRSRINKNELSE